MPIPNVIYQIGPHSSKMQQSWLRHNPDFSHVFLTDRECDLIMRGQPDALVRAAYRAVVTGAQRADLCRMGVILSKGGFYVDTDTVAYAPIPSALRNASMMYTEWGSFEFFGAVRGHPFVSHALARAARGIRDELVSCRRTHNCCSNAHQCIVRLSGPKNFFAALIEAGIAARCVNKRWIASRPQCADSPHPMVRGITKCHDTGVRNPYQTTLCGMARHADCRNSGIGRACSKTHYSRSRNFFNASRFEWTPLLRLTQRHD